MSLSEFNDAFGTDEKCVLALEQTRCPDGFRCPICSSEHFGEIHDDRQKHFQCEDCRYQTTVTPGTIFHSTKLRLSIWYQAIFLISTAKNGIMTMELGRNFGVSCPAAWKIRHKLMQVMKERARLYFLRRTVQVNDACLGVECSGGKPGRGSENKEPFVAALEFNQEEKPIYIKLSQVSGFTSKAIENWTRENIMPGSIFPDGLRCFRAVVMPSASMWWRWPEEGSQKIFQTFNGWIQLFEMSGLVLAAIITQLATKSMEIDIWPRSHIVLMVGLI